MSNKIYVLDTNVILHDSSCIHQFEEHDVVIPITVIEELDNFKKGNESLNFHAREFTRRLDTLSGDKLFDGGVQIGPGLGKISIKLDRGFHPDLTDSFAENKCDHKILNIAYHTAKEHENQPVILLSKDVNLRMKAKAVGLLAQDYKNDHVQNVQRLYTGCRVIEHVAPDLIQCLYKPPYEFDIRELALEDPSLLPNEYLILRGNRKSALAAYDDDAKIIRHIDKVPAFGITPRNAEQTFAMDALLNDDIRLVSLTGKAGTGKTLLALASALKRKKSYRQILMARPIVALSNKDIGFLPGDIHSKLAPYMKPLYDNLGVIENSEGNKLSQLSKLLDEGKLVIEPLSYIRGRSLVKTFFIIDEAQNLTPHEIKTIITRAGEDTKIVFTGDIFQIDHPYLDSHSNGLSYLIEKMQGQKLYAHINLTKGERSELADLAGNLL